MAKTVLVIEDEGAISEMLAMLLAEEGYAVQVARTAKDALARARADTPDLITLDLALPGADGASLLRSLHADGRAPVLVISAHPEALAPPDRALAAGVLAKPFDVDDMLASVASLLH
ncbi:MAG TPA: response regulator [Chloroflexota bacterium]|jgi:two-component system response regulator MtrA